MSELKYGDPAFPLVLPSGKFSDWPPVQHGISIRDYFAAAALRPLLHNNVQTDWPSSYARWAYELADAMLKERAK